MFLELKCMYIFTNKKLIITNCLYLLCFSIYLKKGYGGKSKNIIIFLMLMQIYFNAVIYIYIKLYCISWYTSNKDRNVVHIAEINYNKFKHILNVWCYRYTNIYLNIKNKKEEKTSRIRTQNTSMSLSMLMSLIKKPVSHRGFHNTG